jgi:CBS domain-containing protein/RNA polymerase-binding transcription factor DksA
MGNRIHDWMTYKPLTVSGETAAAEAFDLMLENGIRHLPVLEAEELIGILSIDDLRAAFPFAVSPRRPLDPDERAELRGYRVSDAMSWAPRTLPSSATLEEAARRLSEHRIGCLPIVDDGRLVGILSETDALRALDALLHKQRPPAGARTGDDHGVVDTLFAERERLVEQLARWQDAERELAADIREPRDSADRAADERDIARLEPLSARASRRLRAIDLALERAKHGELGICERCRGRIPAIRLRAVPEATLCIRCARQGSA